jgi:hypothetical protein
MKPCPECSKPLIKPNACTLCGWTKNLPTADGKPPIPTLQDALDLIADEIRQFKGRRPEGMPQVPGEAAHWLLTVVLEKHQPEEAPRLVSKTEGKGETATIRHFWTWPFSTRVKIQARQFLHLSSDFQRYIIAAKEDSIPWRGDDEEHFRKVVSEHQRMQQMGVAAYRQHAMRQMRVMTTSFNTEEAA